MQRNSAAARPLILIPLGFLVRNTSQFQAHLGLQKTVTGTDASAASTTTGSKFAVRLRNVTSRDANAVVTDAHIRQAAKRLANLSEEESEAVISPNNSNLDLAFSILLLERLKSHYPSRMLAI